MSDTDTPTHPTARLLENLGPGEKLIYYRGNLEMDIANCDVRNYSGGTVTAAPGYKQLLVSLHAAAETLSQEGRIRLTKNRTKGAHFATIIEYTAIGMSSSQDL